MYHRVAVERFDPWNLCVSPKNFDEQMAVLARYRAGIDLADLASAYGFTRDGGAIAVTFDDGYVDNFKYAVPILEKYEIPATIFVVAGALGRRREFWWDALTRAFFEGSPAAEPLTLDVAAGRHCFHLVGHDPAGTTGNADWRPDETDAETPLQALFLELWAALVVMAPADQDRAIDQILAWAQCPTEAEPHRLPASLDTVRRLADHPLIRIGSHTQDHVSLTDQSCPQQRWQIETGHKVLEELIGRKIDRFSYPFGRYDHDSISHIRSLGITVACTSYAAAAMPRMNRHTLPRLQATNQDGREFSRWLQTEHGLLSKPGIP